MQKKKNKKNTVRLLFFFLMDIPIANVNVRYYFYLSIRMIYYI